MTASERETIYREAVAILDGDGSAGMRLHRLCDYLRQCVSAYDWVGFYLVVPGERLLVLGPFAGEPTEHLRIEFGRGICGQAAERKETFVVDDVQTQSNYLSCSVKVRAEIVVPVFHAGQVVGEIDIDSHSVSPFTEHDRALLEALALVVAPLVAQVAPSNSEG
ncbi:MAG: GAF domain-containing protein [Spirochaetaceae bacterium]|nr:MAG: GAF domain-containing protein [Spirochaetaceae bacterium]